MKVIDTDILVIGSGLSGLLFAIECSKMDKDKKILVITKKTIENSSTALAQGGIAIVRRKPDSIESHIQDTIRTGVGLSDLNVVDFIIKNGNKALNILKRLGVNFDKRKKYFELGKEGGHSFRRILHIKDKTGKVIEDALIRNICKSKNISVIENCYAIDIDVRKIKNNYKIAGVYLFKNKGKKSFESKIKIKDHSFFYCRAKVIAIATGGLCALYKYTVNPNIAIGDGIAIGYRSGCVIRDLEFIQFHPTALKKGKSPFFLISEAVRGEGARLVTKDGSYIMDKYKMKDLEARDVVSRKIFSVMSKENVYLYFTDIKKDYLRKRFSGIYEECLKRGIDITQDLVPIIPAAHYSCGGIEAKISGETRIKGLYAIGEVASTGLHGANRLASNSLLEAIITSYYASKSAIEYLKNYKSNIKINLYKEIAVVKFTKGKYVQKMDTIIKDILWEYAGIIRSVNGLKKGLEEIRKIYKSLKKIKPSGFNCEFHQLSNKVLVAGIIIYSALKRKESRGCHYNIDYPFTKSKGFHTKITKREKFL